MKLIFRKVLYPRGVTNHIVVTAYYERVLAFRYGGEVLVPSDIMMAPLGDDAACRGLKRTRR